VEVVVDTNVIISALLKEGSARKLLLLAPFTFYTVPYARHEIEKHRVGLVKRAGIDDETFQYLMDKIFERMDVVNPEVIGPHREKAIEAMKSIDPDDAPFIALALYLKCPIISEDKHLKKQTIVRTFTIREILDTL
jgi:predicted nucleic acid-binding protein